MCSISNTFSLSCFASAAWSSDVCSTGVSDQKRPSITNFSICGMPWIDAAARANAATPASTKTCGAMS